MGVTAIVGKSGTGKTTSATECKELGIIGLNPKETTFINVAGKDLPVRGWTNLYKGAVQDGGNYFESSDADKIAKCITYINDKRLDIKTVVLDDAQYIMAFEFMRRAKESGYGKFADIGVNMNKIIDASKFVRKDLKIFMLWHPEQDKETGYKIKTVG